jgi:hypothetical protein
LATFSQTQFLGPQRLRAAGFWDLRDPVLTTGRGSCRTAITAQIVEDNSRQIICAKVHFGNWKVTGAIEASRRGSPLDPDARET